MPYFRKKPITVWAEQWVPGKRVGGVLLIEPWLGDKSGAYVITLEGPLIVSPGDWVITGVTGEKYPCKSDVFEKTYDSVVERE